MALIQFENVTKYFKENIGITDVNFIINAGDFIGFIGDNGAGKTTTIKLILGLLKKDTGQIWVNDGNDENEFRKQIEFLPDQNNYPKMMKIFEYIKYIAKLSNNYDNETDAKIITLLSNLGLRDYLKSTFNELSSGMQKKALLPSVLINNPKVIILDEPTANVDVDTRIEFLDILKELNNKGVSILITSHNIDELQNSINKLIIMHQGKIVYDKSFDVKKDSIANIYRDKINRKKIDVEELLYEK